MLHLLPAIALTISAQAASGQATPPEPAIQSAAPATYQIGATDVLGIKVFGEEALSNNFTVDSDGSITFPLLGRVQVGGKTTREIEEHLTQLLKGDYLRNPQVSVEITTYRSRSIFVI